MKKYLYFTALLPAALAAERAIPITDAQADAIVAADVAAKEAKREAETPNFRVLERRTYQLADRTVTLSRVAPPRPTRQTARPQSEMTPAQRQAIQEEMERMKIISVIATVYDKSITHVRWSDKERQQYSAWIRADFNLFRPIQEFTVGDQTYRLSAIVLNESSNDLEERRKLAQQEGYDIQLPTIPDLPPATDGVTEYYVESDDPAIFEDASAFEGIEAMLFHLDASHADMLTALKDQEALSEARKRYREANPASKDVQINYWINE